MPIVENRENLLEALSPDEREYAQAAKPLIEAHNNAKPEKTKHGMQPRQVDIDALNAAERALGNFILKKHFNIDSPEEKDPAFSLAGDQFATFCKLRVDAIRNATAIWSEPKGRGIG